MPLGQKKNGKDVRFLLTSSYFGLLLTSSLFYDVYDDQKWNFAFRIKHNKYPFSNFTLQSETGSYDIELFGVNVVSDIIQEQFILSASLDASLAEEYFKSSKRIFCRCS